ncbi:MAG: DEAD/DEAH box helicase family protein, partial [Clostridiales bacterium]|nr:DEAD/DEAH box helicase family protein [Clostridiales bacterium]
MYGGKIAINMLYFEIHNNKTFVINADSYILSYLDSILKYPTDIAEMGQYNSENALVHGWDGWVRFLHIPENKLPWFPTGLMGYVCQALGRLNFYYRIEDRRIRPEEMLPHFVDISLRDYQKEAALIGVRVGRGVFAMPPRSGKTRLAIELYRRLAIPTIWIAPTNPIVVQTVEAINSFFGEGFASQLIGKSGEKSLRDASIVVCTAATATRLPLEFYQSRQMIIVDEFHHSSAKSYNIIFKHCDHIYYRFGLTGTFFRSNGDDMAMHAHISNVLMSVDSDYLVKRDNLVSTYVVFIPVISAPLKIGTGIFNEAHGKHGIHHHLIRNQMVVSSALSLKKTGRSVLILVGTKKQGRIIRDM